MSKSDKTKPWNVRAIEHGPIAIHRHEYGACDLPELSPRTFGWRRPEKQHCYWEERISFYYSRNGNCDCISCSDRLGRRIQRRKDRHNAVKKALRDEALI